MFLFSIPNKDKRMENVNRQVSVNVIMYVVTRNKLVSWSE